MTKNLLYPNKRFLACLAFFSFTAVLFGCSKKDQQATPVRPVAVTAAQASAKPVQKPVSSVINKAVMTQGNQFDFSNKKDPFKALVIAKAVTAPSPTELKKALQSGLPIHSFDVSQFRLIGIISGGKENQAMVVDPNGKGYVLKVGMLIGKNDGRIISINSNGVDVLEQFKDDNGRVRKENIRITLPRKQ